MTIEEIEKLVYQFGYSMRLLGIAESIDSTASQQNDALSRSTIHVHQLLEAIKKYGAHNDN